MKSMVATLLVLVENLGQNSGISTVRDRETIRSRTASEGVSFVTLTLPALATCFERWLDEGKVSPLPPDVRFKRSPKGEYPEFLGGFFERIFANDGYLHTYADIEAVRSVRQILLFLKKVEIDCGAEKRTKAYEAYVQVDSGIPDLTTRQIDEFRRMASKIFSKVFGAWEAVHFAQFPLSHSSGALATRETANGRYSSRVWTERLESVMPHWDSVSINYHDMMDNDVTILPPSMETPSRVIDVPKTMKGPRIIAMEPVWNNKVQQGLLSSLCNVMETHPAARGLRRTVYWNDQSRNRKLAEFASCVDAGLDGFDLATLDLSEASDRVPLTLVRDGLLADHEYLKRVVLASRSVTADVRGKLIILRKFASMGSAMTFPLETFVFYTLVCMAWEQHFGSLPSGGPGFNDGVSVYGDDIIVPVDMVPILIGMLEAYGLKVNHAKSFWNGNFRESCGFDGFRGWDVTPVRMTHLLPDRKTDYSAIEQAVALQNKLFIKGLYPAAAAVTSYLKKLGVPLLYGPTSTLGSVIYTHEEESNLWRTRHSAHLQRFEVKCMRFVHRTPKDELDGYGALFKFFSGGSSESDADHLNRAGRSKCVGMNTCWCPTA